MRITILLLFKKIGIFKRFLTFYFNFGSYKAYVESP